MSVSQPPELWNVVNALKTCQLNELKADGVVLLQSWTPCSLWANKFLQGSLLKEDTINLSIRSFEPISVNAAGRKCSMSCAKSLTSTQDWRFWEGVQAHGVEHLISVQHLPGYRCVHEWGLCVTGMALDACNQGDADDSSIYSFAWHLFNSSLKICLSLFLCLDLWSMWPGMAKTYPLLRKAIKYTPGWWWLCLTKTENGKRWVSFLHWIWKWRKHGHKGRNYYFAFTAEPLQAPS